MPDLRYDLTANLGCHRRPDADYRDKCELLARPTVAAKPMRAQISLGGSPLQYRPNANRASSGEVVLSIVVVQASVGEVVRSAECGPSSSDRLAPRALHGDSSWTRPGQMPRDAMSSNGLHDCGPSVGDVVERQVRSHGQGCQPRTGGSACSGQRVLARYRPPKVAIRPLSGLFASSRSVVQSQ
jgi:hypothetical protein